MAQIIFNLSESEKKLFESKIGSGNVSMALRNYVKTIIGGIHEDEAVLLKELHKLNYQANEVMEEKQAVEKRLQAIEVKIATTQAKINEVRAKREFEEEKKQAKAEKEKKKMQHIQKEMAKDILKAMK